MNKPDDLPTFVRVEETDSTNNHLRRLLEQRTLPEGSIVLADFQSKGRGQAGNSWESDPGKNLLFSMVVYPDRLPASRQFLLSQVTSLSVKAALDPYISDVTVKWPNDIYWKEQKICGMLIENDLESNYLSTSLIGIGLNVNQEVFKSNAPNPVSLKQITGSEYEPVDLLNRFHSAFFSWYFRLLQGESEEIRQSYKQALYRRDGFFPYEDNKGPFDAKIREVEPDGHLLLEDRQGSLRRYAFKEVACR